MKSSFFLRSAFFALTLTSALTVSSAVKSVSIDEAQNLKEKLTGQRSTQESAKAKANIKKKSVIAGEKSPVKKLSKSELAKLTPSQRGLALAREAKSSGDYILAIKRYNFMMKHFARTPEARLALLDKAQIYRDMGLDEQAKYNERKAKGLARATPSKTTKGKSVIK